GRSPRRSGSATPRAGRRRAPAAFAAASPWSRRRRRRNPRRPRSPSHAPGGAGPAHMRPGRPEACADRVTRRRRGIAAPPRARRSHGGRGSPPRPARRRAREQARAPPRPRTGRLSTGTAWTASERSSDAGRTERPTACAAATGASVRALARVTVVDAVLAVEARAPEIRDREADHRAGDRYQSLDQVSVVLARHRPAVDDEAEERGRGERGQE